MVKVPTAVAAVPDAVTVALKDADLNRLPLP
jgi:hypothetical protein